ncbi:MAG: 2-hydroxyacid dehydrogenase [Acidiferrobacterales bacterium]
MSALRVSIVTNAKEETASYTNGIFPTDCEVLLQTEKEMSDQIEDIDVLIPGHITVGKDLIDRGKKLKLIHCGTGYNNVDLEAASQRGAYVAVTPNVAAQSVAELVFASILTLSKKIAEFNAVMKNGGWKTSDFINVPELKGKTLGIVGYGNIGKVAARIARGFQMNLLAYDPHISVEDPDVSQVSLEELLQKADFITLHVLLNADTKHMMSEKQFAMMKPTAILVNASRGPVVDENALVQALKQGQIGGACLDVYEKEPLAEDSELRKLSNVMLTPHVAYCANEALTGRYQFFADNCKRVASGETPKMVINVEQVKR